ncbi:MAG: family 43 glycosylhydrolase [Clostridia bacterium]|nr:family 43 glycosylhydrolase [Clostridia bacterium]
MNQENYLKTKWNQPLIPQRADPYIQLIRGRWYFTASVPAYDRIVLRCSDTLRGLKDAQEVTVWMRHEHGPMSQHIWAPELHYVKDGWYLYFAAGEREDIWKIRPWVLKCTGEDPMKDPWEEMGMLTRAGDDTFSFEDFSLDMTVFEHRGEWYAVWAEKVSVGKKISNLYIARMKDACTLDTPQMLLTSPTYPWERHGFWVNEGPTVLETEKRLILTYSASDTSPAYCMGMMWMDAEADPMDISAWHKVNHPVLQTDEEKGMYGPGHNTFFRDAQGNVYTSYHARNYDEIVGDPLYDPNRHTYVMKVDFENGLPVFSYDRNLNL